MRRSLATDVDRLLDAYPSSDPEIGILRKRAQKYATECGCAAGGAFLVASAVAAPIVLTLAGSWSPHPMLYAFLLVFVSSLAGKAAGIAMATARLRFLLAGLRRRSPLLGSEPCRAALNG